MAQEISCPHYGPCQNEREETYEERIIPVVSGRLNLLRVDIDGIAYGLERIERDADGQQDMQYARMDGKPKVTYQSRKISYEEIEIFKKPQDRQIYKQA